jgi:hypothetical protein
MLLSIAWTWLLVLMKLGRVDGFDEDEAECEGDEGGEVLVRLLAAEGDALEALELTDQLLDARPRPVERFREEGRPRLGRGFVRDHRADAPLARRGTVALGVITFVGHGGAGRDVRPEVEQDLKLAAVARLTRGQVEGERQAIEVDLEVDLGREAAARAAERLARLPPLAPAAETWARTAVESNICTKCAVPLSPASASKKASNTPARLRRQKRFQTLFQGPNSAGSARQVMLWTEK